MQEVHKRIEALTALTSLGAMRGEGATDERPPPTRCIARPNVPKNVEIFQLAKREKIVLPSALKTATPKRLPLEKPLIFRIPKSNPPVLSRNTFTALWAWLGNAKKVISL